MATFKIEITNEQTGEVIFGRDKISEGIVAIIKAQAPMIDRLVKKTPEPEKKSCLSG